jgi:serine/threonine protein kinase
MCCRKAHLLWRAYARDSETAAIVFVKGKVTDTSEAWPDSAIRFEREAAVLANLNHPQIPRLLDADLTGGMPYIVTEAMPGSHYVPRWLEKYPAPQLAARVCLSALDPLGYVHDRGITHRDVKTSNLVMRLSGAASLVDFELAYCQDEATAKVVYSGASCTDPSITETGKVRATANYVSPERAQGETSTPLSDIYSLGIVLYELLYGRVPFNGMPWHVAHQHIHNQIDLTPPQGRKIPIQLIEIIQWATEKDPDNRYQSADAMRQDLLCYLGG